MSENEADFQTESLGQFLYRNMLAVFGGVAFIATGYASVQFQISGARKQQDHDRAAISAQLTEIKAILVQQQRVNACQIRTMDKLVDKTGVTPPCQIEGN